MFEIKGEHVRCFDGLRRSQAGTNGFPTTTKAREIVKANATGHNYFSEVLERAIYFDRRKASRRLRSGTTSIAKRTGIAGVSRRLDVQDSLHGVAVEYGAAQD